MLALSRRTIPTAVLTLALGFVTAGCSSDETGPGTINPAVVGTWNATSIVLDGGADLVGQGMSLTFDFADDGTYTFVVTNDQGGFCDGAADCVDGGSWTASNSQIVLDPDDDPQTLNYSISGTTVTITADIEGTPVTIVMDEA